MKLRYHSPIGDMIIVAEMGYITGVYFCDQKYLPKKLVDISEEGNTKEEDVILACKSWLDDYFSGKIPGKLPPLNPKGSDFRKRVWDILLEIRYGDTMTYGEIAGIIANERGLNKMSAQAVGGAVGHNPIGILIPCHRVVGTNGSLTGYAGGLDKKRFLLELEGIL